MKLVTKKIHKNELQVIARGSFGNLVKAVVDVKKQIMVIDAELHSDQEAFLLEKGSKQNDLWGINLYPGRESGGFIEFDSMINLRPTQNNYSRSVGDIKIQEKIKELVLTLVEF